MMKAIFAFALAGMVCAVPGDMAPKPHFDGPFGKTKQMRFAQNRVHKVKISTQLGLYAASEGVSVTPTHPGGLNEVKINGLGAGPLTASTGNDGSIVLSDNSGNRIKINVNVFAPSKRGQPVQEPTASTSFAQSGYTIGTHNADTPEHLQVSQGVPPGHLLLPRPTLGPDEEEDSQDGTFYDQQKLYDMVDGLSDAMAIDIQTLTTAKKADLLAERRKTTLDNEIQKICRGSLCPPEVAFTTNA
jgi:hypothetical protein